MPLGSSPQSTHSYDSLVTTAASPKWPFSSSCYPSYTNNQDSSPLASSSHLSQSSRTSYAASDTPNTTAADAYAYSNNSPLKATGTPSPPSAGNIGDSYFDMHFSVHGLEQPVKHPHSENATAHFTGTTSAKPPTAQPTVFSCSPTPLPETGATNYHEAMCKAHPYPGSATRVNPTPDTTTSPQGLGVANVAPPQMQHNPVLSDMSVGNRYSQVPIPAPSSAMPAPIMWCPCHSFAGNSPGLAVGYSSAWAQFQSHAAANPIQCFVLSGSNTQWFPMPSRGPVVNVIPVPGSALVCCALLPSFVPTHPCPT